MTYLTLDLIKQHLNINSGYTAEDSYLEMLGGAVEGVVEKHIDDSLSGLTASNNGTLPLPLVQACLLLLGTYYSNRENVAFTSAQEVPCSYSYLLDLYKNYGTVETSSIYSDLESQVKQLMAYMEFDNSRTINGDGLSVTTESATTTITIDEIDEGFYD